VHDIARGGARGARMRARAVRASHVARDVARTASGVARNVEACGRGMDGVLETRSNVNIYRLRDNKMLHAFYAMLLGVLCSGWCDVLCVYDARGA
jgi:hypothetical protein